MCAHVCCALCVCVCVCMSVLAYFNNIEWSSWEVGAMISYGMETSAWNLSDSRLCSGDTGK